MRSIPALLILWLFATPAWAATPVDLGEWRLHRVDLTFRDTTPAMHCYCDTVPLSLAVFPDAACRNGQSLNIPYDDIRSIRRGEADPDTRAWLVDIRLDDGATLNGFVAADTALRGVQVKNWNDRGRHTVETCAFSNIATADFWTDPNDFTIAANYPALLQALRVQMPPKEEPNATPPADRLAAANALMQIKEWQQALPLLQGLLRDGHATSETLLAYRHCVVKTGTLNPAIADLRQWHADNPGNAALHMTLSALLLHAGQYQEADSEATALIKTKCEDIESLREARYVHAESQLKQRHWADAAAAAADGLEQEDDSRLHAVHGIACLQLGLGDQARLDFEAALRQPLPDYNYSAVYNNLGGLYELLGRRDEALKQYTSAVEADPLSQEAVANLQRLRAELEAEKTAEK